MNKYAIFDIDGTLADGSHRVKFALNGDWKSFYLRAIDDAPIEKNVNLLKTLKNDGYRIIFLTARNEDERDLTESWLEKHNLIDVKDFLFLKRTCNRLDVDFKCNFIQVLLWELGVYNIHYFIDDKKEIVDCISSCFKQIYCIYFEPNVELEKLKSIKKWKTYSEAING